MLHETVRKTKTENSAEQAETGSLHETVRKMVIQACDVGACLFHTDGRVRAGNIRESGRNTWKTKL